MIVPDLPLDADQLLQAHGPDSHTKISFFNKNRRDDHQILPKNCKELEHWLAVCRFPADFRAFWNLDWTKFELSRSSASAGLLRSDWELG